jgi:hypothetical protein
MKNSFTILPETSLIQMQIAGEFDYTAFKQFFTDLLNNPLVKPGFNILCDANFLDFSKIDSNDIQDLLKLNDFIKQKRGRGKTAFVVSSQLGYGLSRMVEMRMGDSSTIQLKIFLDKKDAEKWLNKESEQ